MVFMMRVKKYLLNTAWVMVKTEENKTFKIKKQLATSVSFKLKIKFKRFPSISFLILVKSLAENKFSIKSTRRRFKWKPIH